MIDLALSYPQLFSFKIVLRQPMEKLPPDSPANPPPPQRRFIQVCQYRSCQRFDSDAVLTALKQYASPDLMVAASACLGQCGSGPTVRVVPDNVWYCRVRPNDADEICAQHIEQGKPVQRLLHPRFHPDYNRLMQRLASLGETV
ncbi:(2Fe-2S) ferredoxin domain-containing protein [Leptothoe sp. PORK10 BA2]|uniref:(2Fe-2S) ferredoxin domain-containing protein n=1 Tax=Leptothoe sp. PORK10 BA2 TaxID=3110254 RepID=UPI002B1F7509|nr:(2Fe-2S) ferredoxin domain-containing protein [Leptothoe sp. PORK10 BA2]